MSTRELINPMSKNRFSLKSVLLRLILPLVLGMTTIGAIVAIGLTSFETTSRNVLDLTHALLRSTGHVISSEVNDYVVPVTRGNRIASEMFSSAPRIMSERVFDSYTSTILEGFPQIQSFYLADDEGHFRMMSRSSMGHGLLELTTIIKTPNGYMFHVVTCEKNGKFVAVRDVPAHNYDVKTRQWYQIATTKNMTQWSFPYLTSEDKEYVLTASRRFEFPDGHQAVFATNLSLNNLSQFLSGIKLGHEGDVMIVDDGGHIVASRDFNYYAEKSNWNSQEMVLANRKEPIFTLAFDHYRVHGIGMQNMAYHGRKYVNMSVSLRKLSEGNPPHWILLIVIPQDDFGIFLHQNNKQIIQFIAIVVTFFVFLSILLFRQIRKTFQLRRRYNDQQDTITRESGALHQVAVSPRLFDISKEPFILTEQMSHVIGAVRSSIWRFTNGGDVLVCEDIYDSSLNTHSGGVELQKSGFSAFFEAIEEGIPFTIADAQKDERTSHFSDIVMHDFPHRQLTLFPVQGFHGVLGVFMLEGIHIPKRYLYFIELMNDIVSIRFSAQERENRNNQIIRQNQKKSSSLPEGYQGPSFNNLLSQAHTLRAKTGITPFPHVAVLVISFADPVVNSVSKATELLTLINNLASLVQKISRQGNLYAVEVAGHRMICMSGCSMKEDAQALPQLATAALHMRAAFAEILNEASIEPVFTMGIDYGPAFGGFIGDNPQIFNLWGQTVSLAELMAKNNEEMGSIQVTERVYMSLRDAYLFRSRGAFYVPYSGLEQTYTLTAGR